MRSTANSQSISREITDVEVTNESSVGQADHAIFFSEGSGMQPKSLVKLVPITREDFEKGDPEPPPRLPAPSISFFTGSDDSLSIAPTPEPATLAPPPSKLESEDPTGDVMIQSQIDANSYDGAFIESPGHPPASASATKTEKRVSGSSSRQNSKVSSNSNSSKGLLNFLNSKSSLVYPSSSRRKSSLPHGLAKNRSVFLSYCRRNTEYVHLLADELKKRGVELWVDWKDIPPGSNWRDEIQRGIDDSENVVFVLSPDWVNSHECSVELQLAVERHKRLIPVLHMPCENVPSELASLNWVYMRPTDNLTTAVDKLMEALSADEEYIRALTFLHQRSVQWDTGGRAKGLLLKRGELARIASTVMNGAAEGREPLPNKLHLAYISRSKDSVKRSNIIRLTMLMVLIVSVLIAAAISVVFALNALHVQEVEGLKDAALRTAKIARVRALASNANQLTDSNGQTAILLAVQSVIEATSFSSDKSEASERLLRNAQAALKYALTRIGGVTLYRDDADFLVGVHVSPDASDLVAVSSTGNITRWRNLEALVNLAPEAGTKSRKKTVLSRQPELVWSGLDSNFLVNYTARSADGRYLALVTYAIRSDRTGLVLLDLVTGQVPVTRTSSGSIHFIFTANQSCVITIDGKTEFHRVCSDPTPTTLTLLRNSTTGLRNLNLPLSCEGGEVVVVPSDMHLNFFRLTEFPPRLYLSVPINATSHLLSAANLVISPNCKAFAAWLSTPLPGAESFAEIYAIFDDGAGALIAQPNTVHHQGIISMVFAPNSELLAVSTLEGRVGLYNVSATRSIALIGHFAYPTATWAIASPVVITGFSASGRVFGFGQDGSVYKWEAGSAESLERSALPLRLRRHKPPAELSNVRLSWDANGRFLASTFQDCVVGLWDMDDVNPSTQELHPLRYYFPDISANTVLQFSKNGTYLGLTRNSNLYIWITAYFNYTVQSPSLQSALCPIPLKDSYLKFHPVYEHVVAAWCAGASVVHVINLETQQDWTITTASAQGVESVVWRPDGKWLLVGSTIFPYDLHTTIVTSQSSGVVIANINQVTTARFHPSGNLLVIADSIGMVSVFDVSNMPSAVLVLNVGPAVHSYRDYPTTQMDITSDWLVIPFSDGLRTWKIFGLVLTEGATYSAAASDATAVKFSPDGSHLVADSDVSNTISLFRICESGLECSRESLDADTLGLNSEFASFDSSGRYLWLQGPQGGNIGFFLDQENVLNDPLSMFGMPSAKAAVVDPQSRYLAGFADLPNRLRVRLLADSTDHACIVAGRPITSSEYEDTTGQPLNSDMVACRNLYT
mmetsp:Transcript_7816/g.13189  ORF Transcript_7816/g.13189 Transcript_7816/m.13189 type:complete len:1304 (-) Transcript_7816:609-4520(-)